jgi:hypothetical protein
MVNALKEQKYDNERAEEFLLCPRKACVAGINKRIIKMANSI